MAFMENPGSDQLSGRTLECPYWNPGQQSYPQLLQVLTEELDVLENLRRLCSADNQLKILTTRPIS